MRVKPAEGMQIRRPENYKFLPPEGAGTQKKFRAFWNRRIRDGSVVEIIDEPVKKEEKPPEPKAVKKKPEKTEVKEPKQ